MEITSTERGLTVTGVTLMGMPCVTSDFEPSWFKTVQPPDGQNTDHISVAHHQMT